MIEIIKQIKKLDEKKVLIIGDVMLDEYIFGTVERISPEAPVAVVKQEKTEWSPGGAANVAQNCKKIGCDAYLIGMVGTDACGKKLLSLLESQNISTTGILKSDQRTTITKKRVISTNQQLLRLDFENSTSLSQEEKEFIINQIKEQIPVCSLVLISDYSKGLLDEEITREIIKIAKANNVLVLLDPKGPNFYKYKDVDYIKPNLKEFKQMVNFFGLDQDRPTVENGKNICNILNLKGIVITLGEKGIQYISKDEIIFSKAIKREVYDLTGAGDTVFAFLGIGLVANLKMEECLRLANHAAAIAIAHIKTYAVSLNELIDSYQDISQKYVPDWNKLKSELDWLKSAKRKIVFTNGCFDLIHIGHIHLLKEAKKRGDVLVVAINSDESIKRLKGNTRPIQNIESRSAVLSAIGVVDFVTQFSEDTPLRLIEFLKPDLLIKGSDYQIKNIVGYDFIKSYGGEIETIDLKAGHSTTNFIKKIEQNLKA